MSESRSEEQFAENQKPKNKSKRVGIFLIVLSCILYGVAFIIPFTTLPTSTKVIITPLLVVLGEIAFWVSCIIVGKELMKRYRKHLNPVKWFKKSKDENTEYRNAE
ncbi:transporter suffix domain-containing protein [Virgibacillus sp. FSP13]